MSDDPNPFEVNSPSGQADAQAASPPAEEIKVPAWGYIVCGWPLLMIVIGGAIGGALGGAAFGINLGIFKSELPIPLKIVFILLSGMGAFAIWLAIGIAITVML